MIYLFTSGVIYALLGVSRNLLNIDLAIVFKDISFYGSALTALSFCISFVF